MRRSAVVIVLALVVGQLVLHAAPAYACSCRADVVVADQLAESDAAFVGVFAGRAEPARPVFGSMDPVVNRFTVERSVKGVLGERVDVEAAAGGASCGLELEVGERTGLFLRRGQTGWQSSLCEQTEPAGLLALAPAGALGGGSERGFFVAVGVLALAGVALLGVQRIRRREP